MKKPRNKVLILGAAISVTLILLSFNTQIARSQTTLPCCDKWDPGWTQRDKWGPGMMGPGQQQRMQRHWSFMHEGIPSTYVGARNPFSPDKQTITEGRKLYSDNCASCHGKSGLGDGDLASSLSPSPALLAYMIQMPMSVDPYMLWAILDGGAAFGTAMPAFKEALSQDEIWKIVTFMRAGFPIDNNQ